MLTHANVSRNSRIFPYKIFLKKHSDYVDVLCEKLSLLTDNACAMAVKQVKLVCVRVAVCVKSVSEFRIVACVQLLTFNNGRRDELTTTMNGTRVTMRNISTRIVKIRISICGRKAEVFCQRNMNFGEVDDCNEKNR